MPRSSCASANDQSAKRTLNSASSRKKIAFEWLLPAINPLPVRSSRSIVIDWETGRTESSSQDLLVIYDSSSTLSLTPRLASATDTHTHTNPLLCHISQINRFASRGKREWRAVSFSAHGSAREFVGGRFRFVLTFRLFRHCPVWSFRFVPGVLCALVVHASCLPLSLSLSSAMSCLGLCLVLLTASNDFSVIPRGYRIRRRVAVNISNCQMRPELGWEAPPKNKAATAQHQVGRFWAGIDVFPFCFSRSGWVGFQQSEKSLPTNANETSFADKYVVVSFNCTQCNTSKNKR